MSQIVRMIVLAEFEAEVEVLDDFDERNLMQYSTRKNRTAPFSEIVNN